MREELQKAPFIRIFLPFVVGILCAIFLHFTFLQVVSIGLFFLVLFILSYLLFKQKFDKQWLIGIVTAFLFFAIGLFVLAFQKEQTETMRTHIYSNEIQAEIYEAVKIKEKTVSSRMEVTLPNKGSEKMIVYFEKSAAAAALNIGDVIIINAVVQSIPIPKNPDEFNYNQYCFYKGITKQVYVKKNAWIKVAQRSAHPLRTMLMKWRANVLERYKSVGITGKEFGLIGGLVFGYTNELDKDLMESFSVVGVIHILSVSGLHVGIVYMLLGTLLFFTNKWKKGKWFRFAFIMMGVWGYAAISGFSTPVIRAAVMFAFVEVGKLMGRSISPFNTLAASAFFILLIDPYAIMDVGFQLSYLAVAGIMLWYQPIYNSLTVNNTFLDKIWALLCVSLTAQLATFPLSVYYFHHFPVYFLLANLIIVPLSSLILYSALLFIPISFAKIGLIAAYPLKLMLQGLCGFTSWMSNLPFAQISAISLDRTSVVFIYLLLISITLFIAVKRASYLLISLFSILIIASCHSAHSIENNYFRATEIYNIKNNAIIGFLQSNTAWIIPLEKTETTSLNNHFAKNNISIVNIVDIEDSTIIENVLILKKSRFILKNNTSIVVIRDSIINNEYASKLGCDILIIDKKYKGTIAKINSLFQYKYLMFNPSINNYQKQKWVKECINEKIKWWDLNHVFFSVPHI